MSEEIIIPEVGESITEGIIGKWHQSDGDMVEAGDVLLDFETDKITQEVTAPVSGRLEITAQVEDTVQIGASVGKVHAEGAASGESKTKKSDPDHGDSSAMDLKKTEPVPPPSVSQSAEPDEPTAPQAGDAEGEGVEIVVPTVGESITEGMIGRWHKQNGETVEEGEAIVDFETDKITQEINAPASGRLTILHDTEATVAIGAVIGRIAASAGGDEDLKRTDAPAQPAHTPVSHREFHPIKRVRIAPAARRIIQEEGLDPSSIHSTGPNGLITKPDVIRAMRDGKAKKMESQAAESKTADAKPAKQDAPPTEQSSAPAVRQPSKEVVASSDASDAERVTRKKMTPLRKTIAKRLLEAKNGTAMLTTFNEVDLTTVIEIRNRYKDAFADRYGVKLGFMSFFVKATIDALKQFPAVNSSIDDEYIEYHNYYNIGIAVSTEKGLMVPVIRDADRKTFADIESDIKDFGSRAQKNKIEFSELQGGTFTITNGGVFGSMMSTPILNPPQAAILGMHAIQKRPIVVQKNGADSIEIRPMMYIALSYDHRLIDGRESVSFLVRIKECLENPERMLLEL